LGRLDAKIDNVGEKKENKKEIERRDGGGRKERS
jgi:hypothetical protein